MSFRSSGGRPLATGGGIVPDVVLAADTLSTLESSFAQVLGGHVAAFRDVLAEYALELRRGGGVTSPNFTVTPAMRGEVRGRLDRRGVPMADSLFDGGQRIVTAQLGYEVARYVFGPAAERRRRVAEDAQVQEAVGLLRGTTSPQALLGMAETAPQGH